MNKKYITIGDKKFNKLLPLIKKYVIYRQNSNNAYDQYLKIILKELNFTDIKSNTDNFCCDATKNGIRYIEIFLSQFMTNHTLLLKFEEVRNI